MVDKDDAEIDGLLHEAYEEGKVEGREEGWVDGVNSTEKFMMKDDLFIPVAIRAREHWSLGVPLEEAWLKALEESGVGCGPLLKKPFLK